MQAAERPKDEIERAVMSAVDFAQNPADLMYIGVYLTQLGLDERALQIFRQVAADGRPAARAVHATACRRPSGSNDLEGMQWASLGILSQAWPKEQAEVWKAGLSRPRTCSRSSAAEKRPKEADAFEAALDEAVRRDCVVVVTWTGEADIDMMVEEPSGSVCSLRNPRTTAGGVLLGRYRGSAGTATAGAAIARSMSAPRVSTAPTGCWCGGCGAMWHDRQGQRRGVHPLPRPRTPLR